MTWRITMDEFEALRSLEGVVRRATDLSPVMARIAEDLLSLSDDAFATESDPATGSPWYPLQESTILQRIREGYDSGPMLQKTRRLRQSVQTDFDARSAEIGSSVEYALTHQLGSDPIRAIPERPFVGASFEDLADFEDMLADYISRDGNNLGRY